MAENNFEIVSKVNAFETIPPEVAGLIVDLCDNTISGVYKRFANYKEIPRKVYFEEALRTIATNVRINERFRKSVKDGIDNNTYNTNHSRKVYEDVSMWIDVEMTKWDTGYDIHEDISEFPLD